MTTADETRATVKLGQRLLLLAVLASIIALLTWRYGGLLSLDSLADHERSLLKLGREQTGLIIGGLFALYVAVTASSVPAATALTLLTGWLFRNLFGSVGGFVGAVVLVSFAGAAGATLAFLFSRYLLRNAVRRRYEAQVARFDEAFRRHGAFFLISLRLTPFVPFWLVNLAMGLTPIRTSTFWWVGQLGMLPATCVFVFAGFQVPTLGQLEQQGVWDVLWPGPVLALSLLAFLPWVGRFVAVRFGFTEPRVQTASSFSA